MDKFKAAVIVYILAGVAVIALLFMLSGCQALREHESRKITAWGIWAVPLGSPIGIGYWHSERGDEVKSEESAKPSELNFGLDNRDILITPNDPNLVN